MKVKVPVQDAWVGRAGSLPPPPGSVGGAVWRVILAHLFGGFSQSIKQAGFKAKKREAKRKKRNVQLVDL
jgi:hypothetical protein